MVSASYHVQAGRCALGAHEDEYAGGRELYVLELHYGELPRLRPVRDAQEIGICLEHWREAEIAIGAQLVVNPQDWPQLEEAAAPAMETAHRVRRRRRGTPMQ